MSPLPPVAPLPFVPDAVIFDMDGLMLDSERAINACMAQAARDLGHDLPDALWLQMIGGGDGLCRRLVSEQIGEMAAERPAFIASLGPISPHGVVPAAGGVIVADDAGRPLGAVGVTGDTSDNDEMCALAGIAAAGLAPARS